MKNDVLTLRALSRATLARQMLLERKKISAVEAVERLAGMQSQLVRPPFVGLWTRVQKFERAMLEGALEERSLVRATLMRGTIHLFSAKDYVALRGVIQRALDHQMKAVLRQRTSDFDEKEVVKIAREFFATPRSFDEMRKAMEKAGGDVRSRAYAARLLVPLVQMSDGSAKFVLADKWLGKKIPTEREGDAREIVKRYLSAFGPATIADAQTWSGIQDIGKTIEAMKGELAVFRDDKKREVFDLPKAPRPDEDADAPPRFLPEYDNLVLSHKDRRRFVADEHRRAVYVGQLRVAPTFLVDGSIGGTWKHEKKKGKATLTMTPLVKLSKKTKDALAAEAAALVRFVEPDAATFEAVFA